MLGSLRRAAKLAAGLILIYTVLIFTVVAQKTPEETKKSPAVADRETARKSLTTTPSAVNNPPVSSLTKPATRNETNGEKAPDAVVPNPDSVVPPEKKSDNDSASDDDGESDGESDSVGDPLNSNDASVNPGRYRPRRGMREYNFEPGFSPFDPTHYTGEKTYNTAGRKLGTTHFRIGRVIGTTKAITITYLYGFTPFVVSLQNEVKNPAYISPTATPYVPRTRREPTYGVGFSPAQMRFTFFPKSQLKPFVQAGAGVMFFNKPKPIPESRRLQFSGEYGGGFIVHTDRRRDRFWLLGYRYFHISNANIGGKQWNPGYNANVFYIGYSFFR